MNSIKSGWAYSAGFPAVFLVLVFVRACGHSRSEPEDRTYAWVERFNLHIDVAHEPMVLRFRPHHIVCVFSPYAVDRTACKLVQ